MPPKKNNKGAAALADKVAEIAIDDANAPQGQKDANKLAADLSDVKGDKAIRQAACEKFSAGCKIVADVPYLLSTCLDALLKRADDKDAGVREAACTAVKTGLKSVPANSVRMVCRVLFDNMAIEAKWRVKEAALIGLCALADEFDKQINAEIPTIIGTTNELLWDTREEVASGALKAIEAVVDVIANRDIDTSRPAIINSMKNQAEVPEMIQTLASVTFVQTVDEGTLGLLCPLLMKGFLVPNTSVKRQCAVIISNMAKLVESPSDAAPFLEILLPALDRASDEIADPEARKVTTKARDQLLRIQAAAKAEIDSNAGQNPVFVRTLLDKELGADKCAALPVVAEFAVNLITSLVHLQVYTEEEWKEVTPFLAVIDAGKATACTASVLAQLKQVKAIKSGGGDETDDAPVLYDGKFTLAYGSKILLHNTELNLRKGHKYGLLGGNDSGKTSLMRAIANASIEGFPKKEELRSVFVEADIIGDLSHLNNLDYVMEDPQIQEYGVAREQVAAMLKKVGFTDLMIGNSVSTLSGGWRMKLALSRAMVQKAQILLMDEPTNHLDVLNVQWVMDYISSLKDVTCIMVSHHKGLLDQCCTHMLTIADLKLHVTKGNLSHYVKDHPEAQTFFDFNATKLTFKFPNPGFLAGIKSKGRALMKMVDVTFTYPTNTLPTISNVTIQVSLGSRVACVGVNGAGKSTMVKLLTGELEPQTGTVWKHPGTRVAYVAQHAFIHIEKQLQKTANEYIRWRYQFGEDREGLEKVTMVVTPEEEAIMKKPVQVDLLDEKGNIKKSMRLIEALTGARRNSKNGHEYEISFRTTDGNIMGLDKNLWWEGEKLEKLGWTKHLKQVDTKVDAREGMYQRPLTQDQVELHLEDVGLDREFGTHNRMSALSGGQKVKVVLAAAMWNQPHIVILDEPTNYLDRESLGALAGAIRVFEGGIVMITHNNEFCSQLCPETWVVEKGRLTTQGDPEWMKNIMTEKTTLVQLEEFTDASGNVVKVKQEKKKVMSRAEKKAHAKKKAAAKERGEVVSDSEED